MIIKIYTSSWSLQVEMKILNIVTNNLLQRLKDTHCTKSRELDALKLSSNMINIKSMEFINKWSFGEVYKIKWWRFLCVGEMMYVKYNKFFLSKKWEF